MFLIPPPPKQPNTTSFENDPRLQQLHRFKIFFHSSPAEFIASCHQQPHNTPQQHHCVICRREFKQILEEQKKEF
jgi:hypothetical protein